MNSASLTWAARALASCFFTSYPFRRWKLERFQHTGAGFVGTLFGLASAPLLPDQWDKAALTLLGAIFLSIVISDIAEESMGHKDDPRITIDEWVGYLCAIYLIPKTLPWLLAAFVLFRLLDVIKPSIIGRACVLPGGLGVVVDDVLAGFTANLILHAVLALPFVAKL